MTDDDRRVWANGDGERSGNDNGINRGGLGGSRFIGSKRAGPGGGPHLSKDSCTRIHRGSATQWKEFQERGQIKTDYAKSEQHKACLQELLDFLDKDSPDQVRFDAIKGIFLTGAAERLSSGDSFLPQQNMRMCPTLSAGEVVVLTTIYEAVQQDDWNGVETGAVEWQHAVAARSGLLHAELVEVHKRRLIEENLLTRRIFPDQSGIQLNDHWCHAAFGWELCRFIYFAQ